MFDDAQPPLAQERASIRRDELPAIVRPAMSKRINGPTERLGLI